MTPFLLNKKKKSLIKALNPYKFHILNFSKILKLVILLCLAQTSIAQINFTKKDFNNQTNQNFRSIVMGDLNNDSYNDLIATIGTGNGGINVYINKGNGTYFSPIKYNTNSTGSSEGLAIGDLNGDGNMDLVVTNFLNNNICVLTNTGNGSFNNPILYDVGEEPGAIAIADLNKDNKLDIAVVNERHGSVSVLTNTGGGSFGIQIVYSANTGTFRNSSISINDLNNDGYVDIITGPRSIALINNQDATFSLFGYGGFLTQGVVATEDINADGLPDYLILNSLNNSLEVNTNSGFVFYPDRRIYNVGINPTALAVKDINNDGKPDVAISNKGSNNISVLTNTGNGIYGTQLLLDAGTNTPADVAIGDLNNDGKPDIVSCSSTSDKVSVYLQKNDGTFDTKVDYGSYFNSFAEAAGDVNGDGNIDLVITNGEANGSFIVLTNTGNGDFSITNTYQTEAYPRSVALADVNNDGKLDVIIGNTFSSTISVYTNTGNGDFSSRKDFAADYYLVNVLLKDLNADGKLDLITVSFFNGISVSLNDGFGNFNSMTNFLNIQTTACTLGDINNDNKIDILATREFDCNIYVLTNSGSGMFSTITGYNPDDPIYRCDIIINLSLTDVNGDSKSDIVIIDNTFLKVLINDGNNIFQPAKTYGYSFGTYAQNVSNAIGDINGDSKPDVFILNRADNKTHLFLNNGNGVFNDFTNYSLGQNSNSRNNVLISDINNDGKNDLVNANLDHLFTSLTNQTDYNITIAANNFTSYFGQPLTLTGSIKTNGTQTVSFYTTATNLTVAGTYPIYPILNGTCLGVLTTIAGTLTVIPAMPTTIIAGNFTRQFGAANPNFTGTVLGNNNISVSYYSSADVNSNVGTYPIYFVVSSGANSVSTLTTIAGTLTITPQVLKVSPLLIYNATTNPIYQGTPPSKIFNRRYGQFNALIFNDYYYYPYNEEDGNYLYDPNFFDPVIYTTNASLTSPVGDYPLTLDVTYLSSTLGSNYSVTGVAVTIRILPALLTITASNLSSVYGQTPNYTSTIIGLVNNENVTVVYNSLPTSISGVYTIIPSLTGVAMQNYTLRGINYGLLTVTSAPLTVTALNTSVVYGQSPIYTSSIIGLANGETVNVNYILNGNQIIPSVTGAALVNYNLTTVAGLLTITKAPLTVTAFSAIQLSGQPTPIFSGTIVGLASGDKISVNYVLIGNKITPSVTGSDLNKYDITTVAGTLFNTPQAVVITPSSATIKYGDSCPVFTGTVIGVLPGDDVQVSFYTPGGNCNNFFVGNNYFIVNKVTGNDKNKYYFFENYGTLTVEKADLFIKALNTTVASGFCKPYSEYPIEVTGFRNNDSISVFPNFYIYCNSGIYSDYSITPYLSLIKYKNSKYPYSEAVFNNSSINYNISITSAILTPITFNTTIIAGNFTRLYGTPNPYTGFLVSVLGNNYIGAGVISNTDDNTDVGTYPLIPYVWADDYPFSRQDGKPSLTIKTLTTIAGTLTILPRNVRMDPFIVRTVNGNVLVITVSKRARLRYGSFSIVFYNTFYNFPTDENGDYDPSATGFVDPVKYITQLKANSGVGVYDLKMDTTNAKIGRNYNVTVNDSAVIEVLPALLTITANNLTCVYGEIPNLSSSFIGLVNGDILNVNYQLIPTNNNRIFTIIPSISGIGSQNYTVRGINFGLLTITSAPLTVTALNTSVVYGQSPVYTSSIIGLAIGESINVSYILNGNQIIPSVSGAALVNYSLTTVAGVLTITKAPLKVTAFNATIPCNQSSPTFSSTTTGLVNGDNISIGYFTVGSQIIPSVTGASLVNYQLTTVAGVLTSLQPTILVNISPSTTVCSGIAQTFTSSAIGTNLNYVWSNGQTTPNITTSLAGIFSLTVSGTCGILATTTSLVVNPSTQFVTIPTNATVCSGIVQTFNSSATGTYISYLWSNGQTTPNITTSIAGIYGLTVSGTCGILTTTTSLVVNPLTQWVTGPTNATVCSGIAQTFISSAIGTNINYLWSNGQTTSNITTSLAGVYSLTVSGSCGIITTTTSLVVNPLTQWVTVPTNATVCSGIAQTFISSATGTNISYLWSNGQTTPNITTSIAGVYGLTISGTCGILVTITSLVVNPLTQWITKPTNATVCSGITQTFNSSAIGTILNYVWSNGQTTPNITTTLAGVYSLTVAGSCGIITTTTSLVVNPLSQWVTVPTNATVCSGIAQTFTSSATGTNISYLWSNGQTTPNITTTLAGVFGLTVSGSCGIITTTTSLVVYPLTQWFTVPTNATVCSGIAQTFISSATGTNISYLWSNGQTTPNITTSLAGIYGLTVSGSCGALTSALEFIVNDNPPFSLGSDSLELCLGESITLSPQPYNNSSTAIWNTGETNPNLLVDKAGVYTLTLMAVGCTNQTKSIKVYATDCNLYIPKFFTPNGDSQNDTWDLTNLFRYPNAKVTVLNRWGEVVKILQSDSQPWDANVGNNLKEEVFYYLLDLGNGQPTRKGSLSVLRQ